MVKKENFSVGLSNTPTDWEDSSFLGPDPEEGHRLIRSFLSIKESAPREAIIQLVTKLSALDDEKQ